MKSWIQGLAAVCVVVGLAGCATTEGEPVAEARAENSVCSQERPVGTNIAKVRCRTPEQLEREREGAANALGRHRGGAGAIMK